MHALLIDSYPESGNLEHKLGTKVIYSGASPMIKCKKGGPNPEAPSGLGVRVAEARGERLFTKNTGPCEAARRCIRTDACPVLEGQEDPSAPLRGVKR